MGFDLSRGREWVNQNSAAVTIGAVVILIFSLAYLWFQNKGTSPGGRTTMEAYYYDVASGEVFADKGDLIPPITRENGNKAFKVYYFSCSECSNESDRFVGYYEGFTDEYKQKLQAAIDASKAQGSAPLPQEMMYMDEGTTKGRLISKDAKAWVTSDSPEGIEINMQLSKACEGKGTGRLKPCYPGMN